MNYFDRKIMNNYTIDYELVDNVFLNIFKLLNIFSYQNILNISRIIYIFMKYKIILFYYLKF